MGTLRRTIEGCGRPASAATVGPQSRRTTRNELIPIQTPSAEHTRLPSLIARPPNAADAADMWSLASATLDENSPYSYLMLAEYFADTCAVAVDPDDGELLGFATGFRLPADPSTLFIWQIAVSPSSRGRNVASTLLDHLAGRPASPRLRFLEATVTPTNEASARTFRRFARRHDAGCVETPLFEREHFPDGAHEPEQRFRIGPF